MPFGISACVLRQRAAREGRERPYRGVLWLPGPAPGSWRTGAAVLASVPCPGAALSPGSAAAYAHGIIDRPPVLTEVVLPHGRYPPKRRLVKVRMSRTLTEDYIVEVEPCAARRRRARSATTRRSWP